MEYNLISPKFGMICEEVWIQVHIADPIIQQGPAERIRDAVREVMKAKGKKASVLLYP